jgi:hypothetical protein
VLASVAVPGQSSRNFEVRVERCSEPDGCEFFAVLVEGDRILARSSLDWTKAVSEPAFRPAPLDWGAGDPLDPQTVTAAVTGDDRGIVGTIVRAVSFDGAVAGLLIDQVKSFGSLERSHFVLLARGDRLEQAWSYIEEPGTWSSTAVIELVPGREGIALFRGVRAAGMESGAADAVEAELLAWSAIDRKLRVSGLGGRLHVVAVGPLKSVANALALREQHAECLRHFSVISAASLPEARLKGALLVQYGAAAAGAQRVLQAAQSCTGKTPVRVFVMAD